MGLFDRIKKAISGEKTEDQDKNIEEKIKISEQLDADNSEDLKEGKADIVEKAKVAEIPIEEKNDSSEVSAEINNQPINNEETDKNEVEEIQIYEEGLKKSRSTFSSKINSFLANFRSVDENFFENLEELLIESDVGFETSIQIADELREEVKLQNAKSKEEVSNVIVKKMVDIYEKNDSDNSIKFSENSEPTVILFVGVNGAGKTTTIGKLAHRYEQQGKKVLLAAGDTFRAGAIEQLQEWGRRINVPVVASKAQTDPASVAFDAVKKAKEENFDILIVDTAGRLQNKEGLMRELEKIKRVITRELPSAPHEVLLVLDGTTGQNAINQAKQFNETTKISGIVLTKLDGSSQGGIIFAIKNELHIPVKLVGLGEQMDDLRDFNSEKFVYGMFKDLISENS